MKQYILLALAGITGLLCFRGPAETGPETDSMRQTMRLSEHAMALYSRGDLDGAKANFTAVRMVLSQSVGPRDPATLSSRSNIAAVLFAMGDYAGAEAVHRGTIKLRDQVLGRLHMDAVASRHNLAVTLMCEGKYEEALRNERCVESARRHLLGKNDPQSRQARRLRMLIEEAMKNSRSGDDSPSGGPSGIGGSAVVPA